MSQLSGAPEIAIDVYQALYGMAPSYALYNSYVSQIGTSDGYAWADLMTENFNGLNSTDFANLVLTNLGITGQTRTDFRQPFIDYLVAAGVAARGIVVIQLSHI